MESGTLVTYNCAGSRYDGQTGRVLVTGTTEHDGRTVREWLVRVEAGTLLVSEAHAFGRITPA